VSDPTIPRIGPIGGIGELRGPAAAPPPGSATRFTEALTDAIGTVDALQHKSEAAQADFARGAPVELHDVLIEIEEAEIAFRTMMEVRNKIVEAYRDVMRMGG
jgi:flagellar hook-basal body complex protein FliE